MKNFIYFCSVFFNENTFDIKYYSWTRKFDISSTTRIGSLHTCGLTYLSCAGRRIPLVQEYVSRFYFFNNI